MAAATVVTAQTDMTSIERAIRHLISERDAENSKIARLQALEKIHMTYFASEAKRPTKTPATPQFPHGDRFVDVSADQAHVDLAAVHSHNFGELIVLKATEGLGYTDGYFVSRWKGAKTEKFVHRGAYHFLHMDESGQAQAEYFLAELDRAGGVTAQDIVVADAEISSGQKPSTVAQVVDAFGLTLEQHCPAIRWLYSGGPFATENGLKLPPYHGHWLPAYVGDPKPYYVFGTPIAWQYNGGGVGPGPDVVDGIVGPVDLSIIL